MEGIKARDLDEEAEIFQNSRFLRLLWYMNTDRLEEGWELPKEIAQGLDRYGDRINPSRRLAFALNLTFFGFVREDYELAWHWNQRILRDRSTDIRRDIRNYARIFVLILAYQMQDQRYLESALQAAYQRHRRGSAQNAFFDLAIRIKRNLAVTTDEYAPVRLWLREMEDFANGPGARPEFGQAEIKLWLRALESGTPMAELLREKED